MMMMIYASVCQTAVLVTGQYFYAELVVLCILEVAKTIASIIAPTHGVDTIPTRSKHTS